MSFWRAETMADWRDEAWYEELMEEDLFLMDCGQRWKVLVEQMLGVLKTWDPMAWCYHVVLVVSWLEWTAFRVV